MNLCRLILTYALISPLCLFAENLTDIANKYSSDKGTEYACAHHYTRHYERLFSKLRTKKLKIMEIGLNRENRTDCASLRMWLDYFPKAKIFGVDIVPQSFSHRRVNIIIGDQSKAAFLDQCAKKFKNKLDILIDDGSHASFDQQITFVNLFSTIKSDGFYVIEDLHYQPWDEPPMVLKTRAVLDKLINNESFSLPGVSQKEINAAVSQVGSIEYYDSARYGEKCLAVIRKKGK